MSAMFWTPISGFISYYPLKQGLKRRVRNMNHIGSLFISYYPLKQGLKLYYKIVHCQYPLLFISYYPLKQGLKLNKI